MRELEKALDVETFGIDGVTAAALPGGEDMPTQD
jgi:hypothetical protein